MDCFFLISINLLWCYHGLHWKLVKDGPPVAADWSIVISYQHKECELLLLFEHTSKILTKVTLSLDTIFSSSFRRKKDSYNIRLDVGVTPWLSFFYKFKAPKKVLFYWQARKRWARCPLTALGSCCFLLFTQRREVICLWFVSLFSGLWTTHCLYNHFLNNCLWVFVCYWNLFVADSLL